MGPMSQAAQIQPSDRRPVLSGGAEAQRLIARTVAVDAVGLEERAAALAKRSIKKASKLWALDLAIRCMDLTTLEGTDTVGQDRGACAPRRPPGPARPVDPVGRGRLPVSAARAGRGGAAARAPACTWPAWPARSRQGSVRSTSRLREIARGGRAGRRRDRHRPEPLAVPGRPLRAGIRRARGRARGRRHRAPQGDPGDGRARQLRPRAAGVDAGDGGRCRLHQDVDGQDRDRRHPAVGALHDGGRARLPPADRPRGRASRSPAASARPSSRSST